MSDHRSIPQGWARATMQDVASIVGGSTPSTTNPAFWNDGDIPWITPADLSGYEEKTISRGARNITRLGLARSGARLLPAGTVLFSSRAPIGYVAIASNPVATNQGFKSFVLKPGIAPDYIYYYLQFAKPLALSLASGTTFQEISGRKARLIPVVVAPVSEQPRIVEALELHLSRLDDAVATLERVRAKLRAYRASVLKAAVEGRLVPTEAALARAEKRDYEPGAVLLARILKERFRRWEEAELAKLTAKGNAPKDERWKATYQEPTAPEPSKLPEPPEGWCWAAADQVGEILIGRQRSQAYLTGRWFRPYLRVANIKDDRIDFDDVEQMDFAPVHYEKYRLAPGDILVSEGQSPHLVGQSAVYRGGVSELCFQKTLHRFRPLFGAPSSEFAQIVFRANVMLGVFKQVAPITTNIAHLTLEKFKASRFPLPPVSEQQRIVGEAERLLSVADAIEQQVRIESLRLSRLRQAILKWAFEGKLVDQDPADEPAERLLARIQTERAAGSPTNTPPDRQARGAA